MPEKIRVYAASGDGHAYHSHPTDWAHIHDALTGSINTTSALLIAMSAWSHVYNVLSLYRALVPFDTSVIPESWGLGSVTIGMRPYVVSGDGEAVHIVSTTLTAIDDTGDYALANWGGSSGGALPALPPMGNYSTASVASGVVPVNASGMTYIGLRGDHDLNDSAPATGGTGNYVQYCSSEAGESYAPYLDVAVTRDAPSRSVDQCNPRSQAGAWYNDKNGPGAYNGQTFTPSRSGWRSMVSVFPRRYGAAATGTVTLGYWALDANRLPTGLPIGGGSFTLEDVDADQAAEAYPHIAVQADVTMDRLCYLTAGTEYALTWTWPDGTGDELAYWQGGGENYPGGRQIYTSDPGVWAAAPTGLGQLAFIDWVDNNPPAETGPPQSRYGVSDHPMWSDMYPHEHDAEWNTIYPILEQLISLAAAAGIKYLRCDIGHCNFAEFENQAEDGKWERLDALADFATAHSMYLLPNLWWVDGAGWLARTKHAAKLVNGASITQTATQASGFPCTPTDQSHKFRLCTKGDGTRQVHYSLYDVTNSAWITESGTTSTSTGWVSTSQTFALPAGCTQIRATIWGEAGGTVIVDDVRLYPRDNGLNTLTNGSFETYVGTPDDGIADTATGWAITGTLDITASGHAHSDYSVPSDYAKFAKWCRNVAIRYRDVMPRVQIGNELNLYATWYDPNPTEYVALQTECYSQIKTAQPSTSVLLCGIASNDIVYVQAIYNAGLTHGVTHDEFAIHPYAMGRSISSPHVPADPLYDFETIADVFAIMDAEGDTSNVVFTELGWNTAPAPLEPVSMQNVTEAVQAQYITEAYATIFDAYPRVKLVVTYGFRDTGTDPTNNENWFGLISYDWREKPAYAAYIALVFGPPIVPILPRKAYFVKVFDSNHAYITTWNDLLIDDGFTKYIDGACSELSIDLPLSFANFGQSSDTAIGNHVELWVTTPPDGKLLWSGFLYWAEPWIEGGEQGAAVKCLPHYARYARLIYKSGATVNVAKSAVDPSTIMKDIVDRVKIEYASDPGALMVGYVAADIQTTGTTTTYTYPSMTPAEAHAKTGELAPANWHWRIDGASNLHFGVQPVSPTHTFVYGRHFSGLRLKTALDPAVFATGLLFWNGVTGAGAVSKLYTDATAVADHGYWIEKMQDSNVTTSATAGQLWASFAAARKDPVLQTTVELVDLSVDMTKGYDLESVEPGDTCRLANLPAGVLPSSENLLIAEVAYKLSTATLTLQTKAEIMERRLARLQAKLDKTQFDAGQPPYT